MAITLTSLLLFYFGTGKNKKLIIIFLSMQLTLGLVVYTGIFLKKPHLFPLLILLSIVIVIYSLNKIEQRVINETTLISIHALRIPVEIVLFQLYMYEKIPKLMTYNGWNYDIIFGVSALVLIIYFFLIKKAISNKLFIAWNVLGLMFLTFIVTLSVLSLPLKIQQLAFDQPNIAVLEFPYCFLPTCVVPIVLMSHILLLQKTLKPKIL